MEANRSVYKEDRVGFNLAGRLTTSMRGCGGKRWLVVHHKMKNGGNRGASARLIKSTVCFCTTRGRLALATCPTLHPLHLPEQHSHCSVPSSSIVICIRILCCSEVTQQICVLKDTRSVSLTSFNFVVNIVYFRTSLKLLSI